MKKRIIKTCHGVEAWVAHESGGVALVATGVDGCRLRVAVVLIFLVEQVVDCHASGDELGVWQAEGVGQLEVADEIGVCA